MSNLFVYFIMIFIAFHSTITILKMIFIVFDNTNNISFLLNIRLSHVERYRSYLKGFSLSLYGKRGA